jgi:hypothetical protein
MSDESDLCTVLAFDPGVTTGYANLQVSRFALDLMQVELEPLHKSILKRETGEIRCLGPQSRWTGIEAALENDGVEQMLSIAACQLGPIVFEDFIIDFNQVTMTRSALSPVTVMAKFEYGLDIAWSQGPNSTGRLFRQNRSPVKTTCTDDRLKNWGLYDRNSGPHARDAVRHAFYFLRSCRGSSLDAQERRWRAWPHIFTDPQARRAEKLGARNVGERIPGLG